MSITLAEVQTEILQRLGDSAGTIWSGSEIADYIQQAYDELTIQSGCLFAMASFPDIPLAANYNHPWELEFILENSGWYANGPAAFNHEWERDFSDNVDGPSSHNHPFEQTDLSTRAPIPSVVDLPEDLHEIERATWNTKRVEPLHSRQVEHSDSRYELNKGSVEAYIQDKDGVNRLRKWRVPSAPYVPYEFDDDSDDGFGIIRVLGDISDADIVQMFGLHYWGRHYWLQRKATDLRKIIAGLRRIVKRLESL